MSDYGDMVDRLERRWWADRQRPERLEQTRAMCALVWTDGWGDHHCSLPPNHDGKHRCHCDSEAR